MDLQYVEDVAASFVACLFAPVEGAHVCNLAGGIVTMEDFIGLVDEVRPGARQLLRAEGPRVPVATRMDDTLLRSLVPGIPRTPLPEGIERSLAVYEAARVQEALGK
jgi:nucleoside-diphosphate-sugar epimerase